jgi:hypothetical protein
MIIVLMLVVLAVLAIVALLFIARGRGASVNALVQLEGRTRPVDIAAFRNLVAPSEEQYLREQLPIAEFKKVHRERMRAAIEYLHELADNAAVLLRLGESARRSDDPEIAQAGQELVSSALVLRVLVISSQAKLYTSMWLPSLRFSPERVTSSYESLTGTVVRLGRLQKYSQAGSILAAL